LHLGSLYTAVASYLDARAHGGRWLLRIEDLDKPREIHGAAAGILHTLELFGFEWDGEVVRQHDRTSRYADALQELKSRHLTFACSCSRMQLEDELRYPGTCRDRSPPAGIAVATRALIEPRFVTFSDRIQGTYRQDVSAAVGDVILQRRDQIFSYLLAVVVDDAAQGINHVVRGADLLDNTPRQIYVQQLLALPQPKYAHLPVLTEADNSKLAKSRRSARVDAHTALAQLLSVFSLLGLSPPMRLHSGCVSDAWHWAIAAWNINNVPKRLNLSVNA
jgi:glutamyl-Q tRNA(Asp) synthetase